MSDVLIRLAADVSQAKTFNDALKTMEMRTREMQRGVSGSVKLVGEKTKTSFADGSKYIDRYTQTWESSGQKVNMSLQRTKEGFKVVQDQVKGVGSASAQATGMTNDYVKALRRVAIVVPMWQAFRLVMQQTSAAISSGAKLITDLDFAVRRAEVMTSGVEDMGATMGKLEKQTRGLARQTGKSIEEIAEAYTQLATSGIEGNLALQAQPIILKTAVGTMGSSAAIAKMAAQVFNAMGQNVKGATTDLERLTLVAAGFEKVFTTVQVSPEEFTAALQRSAGAASAANLSWGETLSILAAFNQIGIKGAQSGTALGIAFNKIKNNADEVKKVIGSDVLNLSAFEALKKVFQTIANIRIQKGQGEAFQALIDIFGEKGLRQGAVLQTTEGLAQISQTMDDIAGMDAAAGLELIDKNFNKMNDSIKTQRAILGFLRAELGEAFIVGVTGSTNMSGALKTLQSDLLALKTVIEGLGAVFNANVRAPADAIKGLYDVDYTADILDLDNLNKFITGFRMATVSGVAAIPVLVAAALPKISQLFNRVSKDAPLIDSDANVAAVDEVVDHYKKRQDAVTKMFTGGFLAGEDKEQTKELVGLAEQLIRGKLEILSIQGATTLQQKEAQIILEEQFLGQAKVNTVLERDLEIQKEITAQKRGQLTFSADSLKLMQVAQKYGVDVAKTFSEVLAGTREFTKLDKGTQAVFGKTFESQTQQFKAAQYFGSREGQQIPIAEREAFKRFQLETVGVGVSGVDRKLSAAQPSMFNVPVNMPITVQIGAGDELYSVIEKKIVKALRDSKSQISKAVDSKIEDF